MDIDKKLDILEEEVRKLSQRVQELETELHRERTKLNPWDPIGPRPVFPEFTPLKACSKCGLEFNGPMGYCCPRPDCPTGLGPIMC